MGIEGAASADGRGRSIWDVLATAPGRIADGSTGPDAVDHHRRYPSDIALMAELGVHAYRFSISWSRVQPDGVGPSNPAGLDFYDRLVDELLDNGIDPWITLYHWDLPLALMMDGGWLERDTAAALGGLAELVAARLGDRVNRWTTMADPLLHMAYGHAVGIDAPGLTLLDGAFPAAHHLLLGHARAREVLATNASARVGLANHHTAVFPATDSPQDRRAAALYDAYHNGQFTEPVASGRYPRLLQPLLDRHPGLIRDGDLIAIAAPLDFYGVDYFHPTTVAAATDNGTIPFTLTSMPGVPVTDHDWPVHADSLRAVLLRLRRRHPGLPPLVVTENGAAYDDLPGTPDQARIDYLRDHLVAVDAAVAAGADVRGYFHRGLTDAWEGGEGFTQQFGLVSVDPGTGDRAPKASYEFFRRVIGAQRELELGVAAPPVDADSAVDSAARAADWDS